MAAIDESSTDRSDSLEETSGPPVIEAELVDQLPVTLEVRMGSVTLSASELREVEPGVILALGEAGDTVELTSGGQVIARGELVDVNGQLGLRILEIVHSESPEEE